MIIGEKSKIKFFMLNTWIQTWIQVLEILKYTDDSFSTRYTTLAIRLPSGDADFLVTLDSVRFSITHWNILIDFIISSIFPESTENRNLR